VVFCGRLVVAKGVWDVLALATALRERAPEARVALLGDGPEREELEIRIRAERLDNVEVAGFVSEPEKWHRLRRASLFVSPSREEGWGIAVGEALLAGVPALVYDLPAYAHFGSLPRRVPVGDVEAFVQHAVGLIADPGSLSAEWARVEREAQELPRWDQVLAEELAMMGCAP
jgi:glycosyltransferase involved in cell wall biosynthesis